MLSDFEASILEAGRRWANEFYAFRKTSQLLVWILKRQRNASNTSTKNPDATRKCKKRCVPRMTTLSWAETKLGRDAKPSKRTSKIPSKTTTKPTARSSRAAGATTTTAATDSSHSFAKTSAKMAKTLWSACDRASAKRRTKVAWRPSVVGSENSIAKHSKRCGDRVLINGNKRRKNFASVSPTLAWKMLCANSETKMEPPKLRLKNIKVFICVKNVCFCVIIKFNKLITMFLKLRVHRD